MVTTLTDRFVAGAQPAGRFTDIADEKVRGLVLRVGARTKVWYFAYRNKGPVQRFRLGEYPALKLAGARKQATAQRAQLDNGVDPAAERRQPPPAPVPAAPVFTFADFVPTFIAFQKGRKKTWFDDQQKIERWLLPEWGALPLRDITRRHVHELLDRATSKGLTVGVNRIQALISRVFTVALDRQLIDAHPAARVIKRFAEVARDRVLTDDEIRALWAGLATMPAAASDVTRLRLLLGQRGAEVADMVWTELELDDATWSIPRPRTKNKKPHLVALPALALTVIARRLATAAADQARVFPGYALSSEEHSQLASLHGGVYTWIDLRRTMATRLGELGYEDPLIGRLLNHKRATVTGKHYNHAEYLAQTRAALTDWNDEVARILANEPKRAATVVDIRRGR
jgi:integrase